MKEQQLLTETSNKKIIKKKYNYTKYITYVLIKFNKIRPRIPLILPDITILMAIKKQWNKSNNKYIITLDTITE
jgi:hypothetical protein